MFRIPRISISMRELDRLKCIQGLIDKQLKQKAVAERLGLTVRQVRRLVERYELEGPRGLISKLRDRPGNRRLKPERAEEAFAVIRAQYADFGPTLAAEKLRERHGIDLAVETVRSLMTAGGLWLPRRLRPPKVQQPRSRRACIGELVQIDGCEHPWFEDRAPQCTAVVYVDDATSRLMVVVFRGSESTYGYFEATRQYIHRYGKPTAFYSDKASIFMLKHTQSYLAEYGMVQSSGDCDVKVKYHPFGKFQAEEIGAFVKAGSWSQEGNVTVTWSGRPIVEDDQISVRGSDSRQDLLDAVAWQVVKPVTKAFKGASPPR
jgi:Winged helix-turn helix